MSICKESNNTTFIWNFIFEIYRICIKIKRMSKGKKKKEIENGVARKIIPGDRFHD